MWHPSQFINTTKRYLSVELTSSNVLPPHLIFQKSLITGISQRKNSGSSKWNGVLIRDERYMSILHIDICRCFISIYMSKLISIYVYAWYIYIYIYIYIRLCFISIYVDDLYRYIYIYIYVNAWCRCMYMLYIYINIYIYIYVDASYRCMSKFRSLNKAVTSIRSHAISW